VIPWVPPQKLLLLLLLLLLGAELQYAAPLAETDRAR
jgi:hypothetical protein